MKAVALAVMTSFSMYVAVQSRVRFSKKLNPDTIRVN